MVVVLLVDGTLATLSYPSIKTMQIAILKFSKIVYHPKLAYADSRIRDIIRIRHSTKKIMPKHFYLVTLLIPNQGCTSLR